MTKHEHEAPDFADLARQHGASWAGQLTEDELRKAMRIEVHDYSTETWKYRPHPQKRGPEGGLVILLALGMIAVLVTLMIAHAVVRSGIAGGW